ncbi:hypothetical protein ACQEVM_10080 [Streptomyces sp. CA-243310]|uniref:hypothetical protein n=1 Tax=Streptomyces sp. CA-243310 TaxID=3240056 RepID=UPI003D8A9513
MTSTHCTGGRGLMAGTEFWHARGPSPTLLDVPPDPLVARYGEPLAAQQGPDVRHPGGLPTPPGGPRRVRGPVRTRRSTGAPTPGGPTAPAGPSAGSEAGA